VARQAFSYVKPCGDSDSEAESRFGGIVTQVVPGDHDRRLVKRLDRGTHDREFRFVDAQVEGDESGGERSRDKDAAGAVRQRSIALEDEVGRRVLETASEKRAYLIVNVEIAREGSRPGTALVQF
jgi:hypothetical protein